MVYDAGDNSYWLHGAVLLEKLTGSQLVKQLPTFYETRRIITALTNVRHLSLSRAISNQSIPHIPFPEDPYSENVTKKLLSQEEYIAK